MHAARKAAMNAAGEPAMDAAGDAAGTPLSGAVLCGPLGRWHCVSRFSSVG